MAKAAVMDHTIKQRCGGQQAGTVVLAILSRSTAWWHLHMPLAYAQQASAHQFSSVTCRPRAKVGSPHPEAHTTQRPINHGL